MKVVVGLAGFCLLLGGVQVKLVVNSCPGQHDAPDAFDKVWSIVTEALIVLLAPLSVLGLNVLLIRQLHRTARLSASLGRRHRTAAHQPQQPNPATDVMLLSVSLYLVLVSLPLSAVFVVGYFVPEHSFATAKFVVDNACASLYASNFVVYLVTGRTFRRELCVLCRCHRAVGNENSKTTSA